MSHVQPAFLHLVFLMCSEHAPPPDSDSDGLSSHLSFFHLHDFLFALHSSWLLSFLHFGAVTASASSSPSPPDPPGWH